MMKTVFDQGQGKELIDLFLYDRQYILDFGFYSADKLLRFRGRSIGDKFLYPRFLFFIKAGQEEL